MYQPPPGGFGAQPSPTTPWSSAEAAPHQHQQQQQYGYGYPAHAYAAVPAPPRAATAFKVFGLLSIIFAAANALSNGMGIIQVLIQKSAMDSSSMSSTSSSPEMAESMKQMTEMTDAISKITLGHGIAMLVMDIALVAIGILLLKRSELGRKLAIAWASVAFVVLIGRAISFELIMMPVFDGFMEKMASSSSASGGAGASPWLSGGMFSMAARASTYVGLLFMAIFPTTLLIWMNLKSVKQTVRNPLDPSTF